MTEDEKAELADVYEKAATLIEEHGWWNGRVGNSGKNVCVVMAIDKAQREMSLNTAIDFAAETLELDFEANGSCGVLFAWNDANTEEGVINTLHALANKLR